MAANPTRTTWSSRRARPDRGVFTVRVFEASGARISATAGPGDDAPPRAEEAATRPGAANGTPPALTRWVEAYGPNGIRVRPRPFPSAAELRGLLPVAVLEKLAGGREPVSPDEMRPLGQALFAVLFPAPILMAYGEAKGRTGGHVRLSLQIEPPDLARLPWETMHDGDDWCALNSVSPLVRRLAPVAGQPEPTKPPVNVLRVLFASASPEGLLRLDVEQAAADLETQLAEADHIQLLPKLLNATRTELQTALLDNVHILYFAGHGELNAIFLDDGQGDVVETTAGPNRQRGDPAPLDAVDLARYLEGRPTRLIFLAACNTGALSATSTGVMQGFAQTLAATANLPAIVAMQYPISDVPANQLASVFFAALASRRPVDEALADARKALVTAEGATKDVFTPVLYLQAADAMLFKRARNLALWLLVGLLALLLAGAVGFGVRLAALNWLARGEMYTFPAGTAHVGSNYESDPNRRLQEIPLPGFALDLNEVTNRQYERCVLAGVCTLPAEADTDAYRSQPDWPIVLVSAHEAERFCRWIGRRLPTVAEWERAARGTEGRAFPWQEPRLPSADLVRAAFYPFSDVEPRDDDTGPPEPPPGEQGAISEAGAAQSSAGDEPPSCAQLSSPTAVDDPAYRRGNTPEGITHMLGNVAEWTCTPATCANPYACSACAVDTDGGSTQPNVLYYKGFSYYGCLMQVQSTDDPTLLTAAAAATPESRLPDLGFRCAADR